MDEIGKNYRERADRDLQRRLDAFMDKLGVSNETPDVSELAEKPSAHRLPDLFPIVRQKPTVNRGERSAIHAGHRERLRASIRRDPSMDGFSDIEILEILLSFVVPQRDTNVTAHKLLDKFGSLIGVMTADPKALFGVSGMTHGAAMLLPGLWRACRGENKLDIVMLTRSDAVNFFNALYIGGTPDGMCLAFIDGNNRLIALEHVDVVPDVSYRAAVGSAIKYGASGVLPVWFGRETIGIGCDAVRYVKELATVLDSVGVLLLDFIMLTDYGYYTPGPRNRNYDGWVPQYVFIPERSFARSPRALEIIHDATDVDTFEPIGSQSLSAFFESMRNKNGTD